MRKNKLLQKAAAGLLTLALLLTTAYVPGRNSIRVQAADKPYTEAVNIGNYKGDIAPKPVDSAHKEWIFAGWYEDDGCEKAVTDKESATGTKYAKFVPAEVLSVMCQVTEGTTEGTESSKLRVVSTVDNHRYQTVGFEIKIGNNPIIDHKSKEVFEKIEAIEGHDAFQYSPTDIHEDAQYFSTVTIKNIPKRGFATGIRITPYWVTLDGTKVYGVARYARVEDYYKKIVNVPVRLYTDEQTNAGYLEVAYDNGNYEYVGMDVGTVFDQVTVNAADGKVRCVGELANVDNNKAADGMYANLRFQWKGSGKPSGAVTFSVTNEVFCDKDEKLNYRDKEAKTFDVADVVYKYITASQSK